MHQSQVSYRQAVQCRLKFHAGTQLRCVLLFCHFDHASKCLIRQFRAAWIVVHLTPACKQVSKKIKSWGQHWCCELIVSKMVQMYGFFVCLILDLWVYNSHSQIPFPLWLSFEVFFFPVDIPFSIVKKKVLHESKYKQEKQLKGLEKHKSRKN